MLHCIHTSRLVLFQFADLHSTGSISPLCQHPGHGHEAAASEEELEDHFQRERFSAGERPRLYNIIIGSNTKMKSTLKGGGGYPNADEEGEVACESKIP